jgi:hypothetical protein
VGAQESNKKVKTMTNNQKVLLYLGRSILKETSINEINRKVDAYQRVSRALYGYSRDHSRILISKDMCCQSCEGCVGIHNIAYRQRMRVYYGYC